MPDAIDPFGNILHLEPTNERVMTCIVLLRGRGRVVIPHEMRTYLKLDKGDLIQLQVTKIGDKQ